MIDLKLLIQAGVQFGHQTWRWNPNMAPYIWGKKNGVHLIDVSKTAFQLEKAAQFLEGVATEGKQVLWVGTKTSAKETVEAIGRNFKCPSVAHRWVGGTLTNNSQVKKSITKLLHLQDVIEKATVGAYTKKELGSIQKLVDRLEKNVGGIKNMTWPVGALIVVDIRKEHSAVREAIAAGVPVVAIVDTNNDPSLVDYVIPANDDVARSVKVILDYLAEAVERGLKVAKETKKAAQTTAEVPADRMISQMVEQAFGLEGASAEAKKAGAGNKPGAQRRGPVRGGSSRPGGNAPRRPKE
ncbi:MAG: 30S ribosomal protein S2 [candidate division TM6 bacterium GW2011_GWE2_41_16]|nr:MAG: 30S ribosomal protein S2 [candidate division TM6 bacterium GW2011_GWE2_41_16]